MYIKGEDTITSDSNANYVAGALEKLEFFIVQDVNFSETARYADLVLPACPSLEKEGTFTSTERRIQRMYRAIEPLGESKAGLGDYSVDCEPDGWELEVHASVGGDG